LLLTASVKVEESDDSTADHGFDLDPVERRPPAVHSQSCR
jgi:hypothetical protein